MKSGLLEFRLQFDTRSLHWVSVKLHSSRRVMRGMLTKLRHESSHTNAACWQANNPARDNCVAEIHLAHDFLTLDVVAHECCHAAWHRAVLIGIPPGDDSFQEYVAQDTGTLTEGMVLHLGKSGIDLLKA